VQLSYSLADARATAAADARRLGLIVAGQLLVSVGLVLWVLHKRVISPLRRLSLSANNIAEGDLRTEVPALGRDEFGALAKRLERMREALAAHVFELETRVDERTQELTTVNKTLLGTLEQLQATQNHLVQSEKLAALGALVAGVAHELNTPVGNGLTVASSMRDSCARLQRAIDSGITRDELDEFVSDLTDGAALVCRNLDNAAELVRGFKQVAMDRTSAKRRQFSLRDVLQEVIITLSPAFKHTPYKIELDVPASIKPDSFPGPLGQVVTNLLENARLHGFLDRDAGVIAIHARSNGSDVVLVVEDDGCGMSPQVVSHIFDPFFTTKLGKGGNGLGMHIVHNIVEGVLGGCIEVHALEGEGSAFHITFPLTAPSMGIMDVANQLQPNRLQSDTSHTVVRASLN